MRVWGVEDNRVLPADLVRIQDFIMRVRRLHRANAPYLVANLELAALASARDGAREAAQKRLKTFAADTHAEHVEMANEDLFLVWHGTPDAATLQHGLLTIALPEGTSIEGAASHVAFYALPADYNRLRERTQHYVEMANAAAAARTDADSPAEVLGSLAAQGPLTAWTLSQIEKLLPDITLRPFVRRQPVYARSPEGRWSVAFEEQYISIEDMRRAHFPRLEITSPEHLFLELCQALDRRLLQEITGDPAPVLRAVPVHFNLSIATILGSGFAQLARKVPRAEHGKLGFEIHRGDLFQDFALTVNALRLLRQEGFRSTLDGLTPDMLPFVNLTRFEADFIKINIGKDRINDLNAAAREALVGVPKERLVFFRCDNERALSAGIALGVTLYQGWLIDDLAREQGAAP